MKLDTFSDLLQQADIRFVVFDLGRRITRISPQLFSRLELGKIPYPYPLQHHACLGLIGWQKDDKSKHFIWFVKLPLDELGLIEPVSRDEIVQYLVKQIEQRFILEDDKQQTQQEGTLPHGFTPDEERMAVFHAKVSQLLGQPASKHYQHARDYLTGKQGYDQWAFLAIQGLADVTSRLDEENNQAILIAAMDKLPDVPFSLVCRLLEHESINDDLAEAILKRINHETTNTTSEYNQNELVAAIRGLSNQQNNEKRQEFLNNVLSGDSANNIEALAAIAGRCWEDLKLATLARLFLEALAKNDQGQNGFDHLLMDLLAIPGLREQIMTALRSPKRSAELASAMGQFFARFNE